jgi:hypothetical protein
LAWKYDTSFIDMVTPLMSSAPPARGLGRKKRTMSVGTATLAKALLRCSAVPSRSPSRRLERPFSSR